MEVTAWKPGTKVTAMERFDSRRLPHVLSFVGSDTLTIITRLDSNWYYARNEDGREGYVPSSHLLSMPNESNREVRIKILPWYHGKIPRQEAISLLYDQPSGAFLVRESTSSAGNYVLCVRTDVNIENFIIKILPNQRVAIKGDEIDFDDLTDLIEYYKWNTDGMHCQLTESVPRSKVSEEEKLQFKDRGWLIERNQVVLNELLGKGSFSEVHMGVYRQKRVAVKVFKERPTAAQSFLSEASIMTCLKHPHLIKIEGLMFDDSQLYLVMEFMDGGSVEMFLRSRGRRDINSEEQIKIAIQVCSGMMYLESKRIVHRDLASRNVLLTEQRVAKIADFGLACYENMNAEGQLPVKWTAPEAYRRKRFNSNTDMWSFGVLLWEIYSYGRIPYHKIHADDVIDRVEDGLRMESPEGCPEEIYDLMLNHCWLKDPSRRPTFCKMYEMLMSEKTFS